MLVLQFKRSVTFPVRFPIRRGNTVVHIAMGELTVQRVGLKVVQVQGHMLGFDDLHGTVIVVVLAPSLSYNYDNDDNEEQQDERR